MSRGSSAFFLVLWLGTPAALFAQAVPAAQVSGGYSYVTNPTTVMADTSDETGEAPRSGWFADVIGNITPHIGIVGEVAATFTTGTLLSRNWHGTHHAYLFLGGARATSRCCRRVVPFGQVLAGALRINNKLRDGGGHVGSYSSTRLSFVVGGGANIRLGGPVGLRFAVDGLFVGRGRAFGADGKTWRMLGGVTVPMR